METNAKEYNIEQYYKSLKTRKAMKRISKIFLMAIIMVMPMTTMAQESYKNAFMEWWQTDPKNALKTHVIFEVLESCMQEINKKILTNPAEGDKLAEKYTSEQLLDDMLEAFVLPSFKKSMTEADIYEMIKISTSPEGKSFQEHSDQMEMMIGATLIATIMTSVMNDEGNSLKNGDLKIDDIEEIKDCPQEYKDKFNEYFDNDGYDYNSIFEQFKDLQGLDNDKDAEQKKMAEYMMDYLKRNIKAIVLNASYGTLTMEDLDFAIMLHKKPEYQKLTKCINDLVKIRTTPEELKKTTEQWIMMYVTWMTNHGAQLNM